MSQQYRMESPTGLSFPGNQIPGSMVPSGSTYTLDADNRITASQIDIIALKRMGFVLVDRAKRSAGPTSRWTASANGGITRLTGDVLAGPGSGSQTATIAANAVSNSKLGRMGANTLKGNNTSGTANALDLTVSRATAMLNPMVGDAGSGGAKGLAPAPSAGDAAAGKYLKADGTWSIPPAGGITQLTGDVAAGPGSGTQSTTIATNAVSNSKLAQMAAHTFKGNNSGATAAPSDLTAAQLTAALNPMVGDTGGGGTKGLTPAPAPGDAAAGKFLKADGTWSAPPAPGITQLTGDLIAGPGSGSQASALASTGVVAGSYTSANITVDAKGRITAATNGIAGGGSATNVLILQGNKNGTYSAPGVAPSNKLLCGLSTRDDLASTNFNFSPAAFVLASNQLNIARGWYAGNGQIVDPTAADWSGFYLVWFYS